MESAFFARGNHPSTLYLSGFGAPCQTVALSRDAAVEALQGHTRRLSRPADTLYAYGDIGSAFLGPANDVAKLLAVIPEIWAIEVMVMDFAMTWLIGFRHDELYLAGDACPPRGTA